MYPLNIMIFRLHVWMTNIDWVYHVMLMNVKSARHPLNIMMICWLIITSYLILVSIVMIDSRSYQSIRMRFDSIIHFIYDREWMNCNASPRHPLNMMICCWLIITSYLILVLIDMYRRRKEEMPSEELADLHASNAELQR